ncbi:MAG: helix-turn-helix domain-containing protein [Armatimonadetes bacterium]|nr:helix-turn-helix domain-containing protein [Armatimonadota bacterium]
MTEKEVLTLEEAAEFLEVGPEALRKAAVRGDVPGRRIGREWRFGRPALHIWLAKAIPSEITGDPWLHFAGIFQDSSTFQEVEANIASERERQRSEAQATEHAGDRQTP